MFCSAEVIDEYNLLDTFLNRSLLEDRYSQYPSAEIIGTETATHRVSELQLKSQKDATPDEPGVVACNVHMRVAAATFPEMPPPDEAQEKYYFTAADPATSDFPEQRMSKLLKAKYEAGMLKPFNYVNGYARLNRYIENNLHQRSRQRILRQLDGFRPNFRKRMQSLTDMELVMVEMSFERELMEYERIFASMAVPACCWRRTGEVFRGNKEMAEVIHVDIDKLREVYKHPPALLKTTYNLFREG